MADEEAFAWELSKENVAPVHCGRNVDKLNVALAEVDSSNHHSKLISKERELLHNIAAYTGDDPLMSWLEYYKWVQECFPSDMKKNSTVLEQITHEFKSNKKYRNDVRYMKLWVTYADKVEKPLEVFLFLHKNKIGDKLALFYIAWAFLCEKSGKIKDAETIFNRGFQKNAEPREILKKKYTEFNCRVSQAWTKNPEDSDEGSQRKKIRTAQTHGRATLRPTRGISTSSTPLENLTNTMHTKSPDATFTVYTEPDTPRVTRADEAAMRSSVLRAPGSSDRVGDLHPQTASRPSALKGAQATVEDNHLQTSSRKRPHAALEVKTNPRERVKPTDIFRFNEGMLRDDGGEVFCFEEIRAMRNTCKDQPAPSAFLVNASDYKSTSGPSESTDPQQQAVLQDITITTKLALNDINDMFRSPVKQPASHAVRIPKTEEPIIRKLQFSSFCVADDGDSNEHLLARTPARFKPNQEENCTTPDSTKMPSTRTNQSATMSGRLKNKDVLGFSYCQR